jgi:hypothetical protein
MCTAVLACGGSAVSTTADGGTGGSADGGMHTATDGGMGSSTESGMPVASDGGMDGTTSGTADGAPDGAMDAPTDSSSPYATVAAFCTAYAQAICQIGATCEFSAPACESYQDGQCIANATQATASGLRTYDPSNAPACIGVLNSAYGGSPTSVTASQLAAIDSVCARVFAGNAGPGAACTSSDDCSLAGDICASAPAQSARCEAPVAVSLGGSCLNDGDECSSNAYCDAQQGSPSYGTCVVAQTTGQPCSAAQPCDGVDQCSNGTCEPLGGEGAACSTSADCASGLFCDTYTDSSAPTPACVSAYTFARASVDCVGVDG